MGKYETQPVWVEILKCDHVDVIPGTVGKLVCLQPPRGIAVEVKCLFKSADATQKPQLKTEVVYVEKGSYRPCPAPKETEP